MALLSSEAAQAITGPSKRCAKIASGPSGPKLPRYKTAAFAPAPAASANAARVSASFSIIVLQAYTLTPPALQASATLPRRVRASSIGKQSRLTPTSASFTSGVFVIFIVPLKK